MTPIPPDCAMAIAIRASVTVSIAEAMMGMLSGMARVTRGADIGLGGQDVRKAGLEQHVIERIGLAYSLKSLQRHSQLRSAARRRDLTAG